VGSIITIYIQTLFNQKYIIIQFLSIILKKSFLNISYSNLFNNQLLKVTMKLTFKMEENNFANATYKDGFVGDRRYLKGFLAKMNLIFMIHPDQFNNDETKVI